MQEIAISKFKATCLAVLEEVRRSGAPMLVTRFGKPVAEIVPPRAPQTRRLLGCMRDSIDDFGDIVGPVGAFDKWKPRRK